VIGCGALDRHCHVGECRRLEGSVG
jgi:hypothetical protein